MSKYAPEIEALARAADNGGANGGECPQCKIESEVTGMAGGAATCPVCNFCFKYCHPIDRHGEESDLT